MSQVTLSQLPIQLELLWWQGDEVNLTLIVNAVDWSGPHTAMFGNFTLPVSALYDGTNTTFNFTLSAVASAPVARGNYEFYCTSATDITRFEGMARVSA
ncbi:hypothetical protein [Gemmatimonas sp.]|uniref:hypothetical protein n=1 Tax=Gemmatimonas sp. TaxID=1962908 RepID=UPI00356A8124